MEMMFQPLRKYADFNGRASRAEYWLFFLLVFVASFIVGFLDLFLGLGTVPFVGFDVFTFIFWLAMIIPQLAVSVRRLHDRDMSGWWLLIGVAGIVVGQLIPVFGWVIALAAWLVMVVFFILPGTDGKNRYGAKP